MRKFMLAFAAALTLQLGAGAAAAAPAHWKLASSTITYHATDALHPVNGVTHAARGVGNCANGACSFLAGAPVKSFNSGDSNRDLHMLEAVRGGQYPLVTVRTTVPEADLHPGRVAADLEVAFAGHTHDYKQVPFQIAAAGADLRLTGTIPLKLSDFQITPPEFLFIKIHESVPVDVDMTWQAAK